MVISTILSNLLDPFLLFVVLASAFYGLFRDAAEFWGERKVQFRVFYSFA